MFQVNGCGMKRPQCVTFASKIMCATSIQWLWKSPSNLEVLYVLCCREEVLFYLVVMCRTIYGRTLQGNVVFVLFGPKSEKS